MSSIRTFVVRNTVCYSEIVSYLRQLPKIEGSNAQLFLLHYFGAYILQLLSLTLTQITITAFKLLTNFLNPFVHAYDVIKKHFTPSKPGLFKCMSVNIYF